MRLYHDRTINQRRYSIFLIIMNEILVLQELLTYLFIFFYFIYLFISSTHIIPFKELNYKRKNYNFTLKINA